MKHVLVISTSYPSAADPLSGAVIARSMAALVRREGWRVTVISPFGTAPVMDANGSQAEPPEVSLEDGVEVHRPRFTQVPGTSADSDTKAITEAALPVARRIDSAHPVDLIEAQSFFPDGPVAARLAKALSKPLSMKARGRDITYWGGKDFALAEMQRAAEQAEGLLSVSKALLQDMDELGLPVDKASAHYTGLDRDRFRPLDHTQLRSQLSQVLKFPLPDNAPLLVSVGSLIEHKGQHLAIAALPEIPRARLILAGKGEDEAKLRRLAEDLGVAERVLFAGSLDHDVLPLILSAADVMVLPTASEGLANAWVEALACGTPIVTSDVGGAREIITSDKAGRLLPEPTPQAIAASVNAVLNYPPNPMDVAAQAERFSWDAHAAELAAHYDGLLSG
ncbi:glycosyltransferase [Erythrobacter rubeus]|uniref:Glycosyltransferase n=1 Tax=Erythrobacter rubeus TaxID=2760803 RepID=A0ABR8KVP9_9SPHN|nr:glycosyltransferase [Erythrobacter rubeus]MBD2842221.1 glycosyltransferase [Erythrobacter rubeus]